MFKWAGVYVRGPKEPCNIWNVYTASKYNVYLVYTLKLAHMCKKNIILWFISLLSFSTLHEMVVND